MIAVQCKGSPCRDTESEGVHDDEKGVFLCFAWSFWIMWPLWVGAAVDTVSSWVTSFQYACQLVWYSTLCVRRRNVLCASVRLVAVGAIVRLLVEIFSFFGAYQMEESRSNRTRWGIGGSACRQ